MFKLLQCNIINKQRVMYSVRTWSQT